QERAVSGVRRVEEDGQGHTDEASAEVEGGEKRCGKRRTFGGIQLRGWTLEPCEEDPSESQGRKRKSEQATYVRKEQQGASRQRAKFLERWQRKRAAKRWQEKHVKLKKVKRATRARRIVFREDAASIAGLGCPRAAGQDSVVKPGAPMPDDRPEDLGRNVPTTCDAEGTTAVALSYEGQALIMGSGDHKLVDNLLTPRDNFRNITAVRAALACHGGCSSVVVQAIPLAGGASVFVKTAAECLAAVHLASFDRASSCRSLLALSLQTVVARGDELPQAPLPDESAYGASLLGELRLIVPGWVKKELTEEDMGYDGPLGTTDRHELERDGSAEGATSQTVERRSSAVMITASSSAAALRPLFGALWRGDRPSVIDILLGQWRREAALRRTGYEACAAALCNAVLSDGDPALIASRVGWFASSGMRNRELLCAAFWAGCSGAPGERAGSTIARDDGGVTGLQIAGHFGCSGMVLKQILGAGAAVFEELKADRGTLAWYHDDRFAAQRIATATEYLEVVRGLIVYVNRTMRAVCDAVHRDDAAGIRRLVEGGAPVWAPVRNDRHEGVTLVLLGEGADAEARNIAGDTALIFAARGRHERVTQILLEAGARWEVRNQRGDTAVLAAAEAGGCSGTLGVLSRVGGADVNVINNRDLSALCMAIYNRDVDSIRCLLVAGASVTTGFGSFESAIYFAASCADSVTVTSSDPCLRAILDSGISVDLQGGASADSPLLQAVQNRQHHLCTVLLHHGASVSRVDEQGDTVTHHAQNGHMLQILMAFGAPLVARNRLGFTPLHEAAGAAHKIDVLGVLLECRLVWENVNAKTNEGYTALMLAVKEWNYPAIYAMLECETSRSPLDIRAGDHCGATALHLAVERGFINAVYQLVARDIGAMHVEDYRRRTPLHAALEQGLSLTVRRLELLTFLLSNCFSRQLRYADRSLTRLHIAAACRGRAEFVKLHATTSESVSSRSMEGHTPLHLGAAFGDAEVVRVLLAAGSSPTATDNSGGTPLHMAAKFGCHDTALALLEHDEALVGTVNYQCETPLHLAVSLKEHVGITILEVLLSFGASTACVDFRDESPLTIAILLARESYVAALAEARYNGPARTTGEVGEERLTPLLCAVDVNNAVMVRTLLDHGAPVGPRNPHEVDPLRLACEEGRVAVAKVLLQGGASLGIGGEEGITPLHDVSFRGLTDVARVLLDAGAIPGHCLNEGRETPLHAAVSGGHLGAAKVLLPRLTKRQVNKRSRYGSTALMLAVAAGDRNMVDLLLEAGGDHTEKDILGRSCLTVAVSGVRPTRRSASVVQALLKWGADPTSFCAKGFNPLHHACASGVDRAVVQALLDGGAAVDTPCPGYRFLLPIHMAVHNEHADVVRVLTENSGVACGLNQKDPAHRISPLTMAISNGDVETVRVLLEAGALLEENTLDVDGVTNLGSHVDVALGKGQGDICLLLLQAMAFKEQAEKNQP
ncbi:unnamed protein product, partial [Ectocarpus fasciculatus]